MHAWAIDVYSMRCAGSKAQGERPRARRRRRRAAWCGGGELDGGGDPKKRRLSDEQARMLELSFREERKLETGRKVHLAAELGLDPKQVAVWFQNRRARHKSKLLEEEFAKLKQAHDATILHKCHLENEVIVILPCPHMIDSVAHRPAGHTCTHVLLLILLSELRSSSAHRLLHGGIAVYTDTEHFVGACIWQLMRVKDRLVLAEEELARFRSAGSHAISGDGGDDAMMGRAVCSGSPSSSFSTGTCQQPGDDELLYFPDYAYADNSVVDEWFRMYGLM
jgi:hypothetical protein